MNDFENKLLKIEEFRIYLRNLKQDDSKISIKWRNDDEIWSMLTGQQRFVDLKSEKKWIKNTLKDQTSLVMATCLKGSNKYLGNVYLNNIDLKNMTAEFSKLIGDKSEWGKGYGTEMTILMLIEGFHKLGLNRIYAYQLTSNMASVRVNEKCGFKKEGILRQAVWKDGEFRDVFIMSILREEVNGNPQ